MKNSWICLFVMLTVIAVGCDSKRNLTPEEREKLRTELLDQLEQANEKGKPHESVALAREYQEANLPIHRTPLVVLGLCHLYVKAFDDKCADDPEKAHAYLSQIPDADLTGSDHYLQGIALSKWASRSVETDDSWKSVKLQVDAQKAFVLGARRGHEQAMLQAALSYQNFGLKTEYNPEKALHWIQAYQKAATDLKPEQKVELQKLTDKLLAVRRAVLKSVPQSLDQRKRKALQGDKAALSGVIYHLMSQKQTRKNQQALDFWLAFQAALNDQANDSDYFALGQAFEKGGAVRRDRLQSERFYQKAYEAGNTEAGLKIAIRLEKADQFHEALKIFEKLCGQEEGIACHDAARLHFNHYDDVSSALKYGRKAEKYGFVGVVEEIRQVSEENRRKREWKAKRDTYCAATELTCKVSCAASSLSTYKNFSGLKIVASNCSADQQSDAFRSLCRSVRSDFWPYSVSCEPVR